MPRLRHVVEYEFNFLAKGRVGTDLIKDSTRSIESDEHLSGKGAADILKQLYNDRRRWIAEKANSERTSWNWRGHDTSE